MNATLAYTVTDEDRLLIDQYGHFFVNTGGNQIEGLLSTKCSFFSNAPQLLLQTACASQLALLHKLKNEGLLK